MSIKRIHETFVRRAVEQSIAHAPIDVVERHARRTMTIAASRKGADPSRVGIREGANPATLRALATHSVLQHGHFNDGAPADARAFDRAHRGDMMGGAWADRATQGGLRKQSIKAHDYSHASNRARVAQDAVITAASRKVANGRKLARLASECSNAADRRAVKRLERAMRHAGSL